MNKTIVVHSAFGDSMRIVASIEETNTGNSINQTLERSYRLTNTIDDQWWENSEVDVAKTVSYKGGCRSTSSGDFIVFFGNDRNELWKVTEVGFDLLSPTEDVTFLTVEDGDWVTETIAYKTFMRIVQCNSF